MEDSEGAKAMSENPLSSGRSKHIDVRWRFIRELVEKTELKVVHEASEWQGTDIPRKRCIKNCSNGTVRHYQTYLPRSRR